MSLPDHCHHRVHIAAAEDLSTLRRIVANLTRTVEFSPTQRERFVLIVTELGTNLLRHATGGGSLLLRRLGGGGGLECICTDRGPGMADVTRFLRDGQTTGSGLGFGLGAIRRLSDLFAIHSEPQAGTAILSRVGAGAADLLANFRSGAVMLPMTGETHCGDGWALTADGLLAVIDGLGHGPEASLAARRGEASAQSARGDPHAVIDAMNAALRGTRGAVVMVVQPTDSCVSFAGVGNIAGALIGIDQVTRLHSSWGVVGGNAVAPRAHIAAWKQGDVLLLHSDGLSRAVEAFTARRLRYVEPALAAAIILRDAATKLDDQTVIVIRR
jgi:anti-sigma regulatory factor (Ser/Thr protein kinase)